MTEELKQIGLDVGHRCVGRLMRQSGVSVLRTCQHKLTTDSDHQFKIAPNVLDWDFAADAPDQKWAGDLSYVWMRKGWLYLAVILNLHLLAYYRLGSSQSNETRPCNQGAGHGYRFQISA